MKNWVCTSKTAISGTLTISGPLIVRPWRSVVYTWVSVYWSTAWALGLSVHTVHAVHGISRFSAIPITARDVRHRTTDPLYYRNHLFGSLTTRHIQFLSVSCYVRITSQRNIDHRVVSRFTARRTRQFGTEHVSDRTGISAAACTCSEMFNRACALVFSHCYPRAVLLHTHV